MFLIRGPKLVPKQWRLLATGFSNISQAIILFSLAALFVPETVGLLKEFSRSQALIYLLAGLILFGLGVILMKKGNN